MVYELKHEGRSFYCNCPDIVTSLVEMGWTVNDTLGLRRPLAARESAAHNGDGLSGGKSCPRRGPGAASLVS